MSPSEHILSGDLAELTQKLGDLVSQANTREPAEVPQDVLRRLVTNTVRLYAACSETSGVDIEPLEPEVSTTEAVVMASALLKSRDLNPFDLALWFSRARVAG